jgi:putative hydrolase of the HAD superfamily
MDAPRKFQVVALDADDTLWHNESLFTATQAEFRALLTRYHEEQWIDRRLYETERRNLAHYGYGVKSFTLSMIETAIDVSQQRIAADDIAAIVAWGKEMLGHPVELLEGVEETLRTLAGDHRLALVTKGDLFHQESKVAGSGLGDLFDHVAIVAEKDERTYTRVTSELGVDPEAFVMVGNSVRSDVVPVVAIGGRAVHIPYHITWALEQAEPAAVGASGRHFELGDIRQLPTLVEDELAGPTSTPGRG